MTLPIRIEKDEIPFFIAGCAVEAIQWEVEGMRYEEWHAERERGDDPSATWRDEIVVPYLQRRFEALEVHKDGRLFGIRRETQELIDEGFLRSRTARGMFARQMSGTRMAVCIRMLSQTTLEVTLLHKGRALRQPLVYSRAAGKLRVKP
ncbi:MAG: hypothetical protein WB581_01890 [Halobacteriota archaeon]